MPIIRIDFDGGKLTKEEILSLSKSIKEIVSKATHIEDVFVYANNSWVKINIAPVEIFIEMSAEKIGNVDELVKTIKLSLHEWKKEENFPHPINLTLIPMNWKIEIDI
jgi:hypothetical protein